MITCPPSTPTPTLDSSVVHLGGVRQITEDAETNDASTTARSQDSKTHLSRGAKFLPCRVTMNGLADGPRLGVIDDI